MTGLNDKGTVCSRVFEACTAMLEVTPVLRTALDNVAITQRREALLRNFASQALLYRDRRGYEGHRDTSWPARLTEAFSDPLKQCGSNLSMATDDEMIEKSAQKLMIALQDIVVNYPPLLGERNMPPAIEQMRNRYNTVLIPALAKASGYKPLPQPVPQGYFGAIKHLRRIPDKLWETTWQSPPQA